MKEHDGDEDGSCRCEEVCRCYEVQQHACGALDKLAENADNKVRIKMAGGEEQVRKAMTVADDLSLTKVWGQAVLDKLGEPGPSKPTM